MVHHRVQKFVERRVERGVLAVEQRAMENRRQSIHVRVDEKSSAEAFLDVAYKMTSENARGDI